MSHASEQDWIALLRTVRTPVYDHIGFDFTDGGEGWAEVTLHVRDVLLNVYGGLHGGVWTTAADSAMGGAVRTLMQPHEQVFTSQMDFRWLRPVRGPVLRCVGRVLRRGRSVWHCTVECFDESGVLVGSGSGTFVVVDEGRPPAIPEQDGASERSTERTG